MQEIDLFGNEIIGKTSLRDIWTEPPFTRLDATGGNWQKRKKQWLSMGIKSELGRESDLALAQSMNKYDPRDSYTGTSVFDPVLCELMVKWFSNDGNNVLDPFAGGSVRGIVSNYLGRHYTGIDIRREQIESNRHQASAILDLNNQPNWYCGDSDLILNGLERGFDMILSCPPYLDLEVYSDKAGDLSNKSDHDFKKSYYRIIKKTCNLLKADGFAVFVVGDVRGKNGFYRDFIGMTKNAFFKCGMGLYNEAILLENGLNTAAMRANRQFSSGRKLVKVHQNVLIFKKII